MASQTKNKNERHLGSLKGADQVRKRPSVIFGTNDEQGAFSGICEIIFNSIDEARENINSQRSSSKLYVTVEENLIVTVEDDGRGLPMGWNEEEGAYDWEVALCKMYGSGKLDDSQYSNSLGLNGLGLTSMQFASEFMDVWSQYDGTTYYMHFEKGEPIGELKKVASLKGDAALSGTKIRFKPDTEVFPALKIKEIAPETFIMLLRRQAMLLKGLEIYFKHYSISNTLKFYYPDGAIEYLDSLTDKRMLPNSVEFYDYAVGQDDIESGLPDYKVTMKVAFNFSKGSDENTSGGLTEIYHNASLMSLGGSTVEGFERGIVQAFTDFARQSGKITSKERFIYKDIESLLLCVATSDAPGNRTAFKNQTKAAITNPFIGNEFTKFIYSKFRFWLESNTTVAPKVLEAVLVNKKAREEGEEVSKKVINKLTKSVSFANKPDGFRDCSCKIPEKSELYVVEGKSALGSAKLACNPTFQAIIPVRGKTINCIKETTSRVLNSGIIIDLFRVLGCGLEIEGEAFQGIPKFDISKLRYHKIIICTDADVDGYHIRCLLITMFYVLAPSLLKAGRVFIAETPLFEIKTHDGVRFAYNDKEKDNMIAEMHSQGIKDTQIKIKRSKGLGENSAEMMNISTMNPNTRRLIPLEYDDNQDTRDCFASLMGDDIESRREIIDAYFEMVDEM